MSQLTLSACPICLEDDSLIRESKEMRSRTFIWYDCRQCGSVLLWLGDDQWTFQRIEREDKAHLLKQPMTSSELRSLLPESKYDVPESPVKIDSAGRLDTGVVKSGRREDTRICPYCAEETDAETTVCRYCGKDETEPPSSTTDMVSSEDGSRRNWFRPIALIAILALVLVIVLKVGVYTIQPIGALPEGKTLIVWRDPGEPFFSSPDAMCLQRVGKVSLLCRGVALTAAPVDRIILRLPYMEWAYLLSTGGKQFER